MRFGTLNGRLVLVRDGLALDIAEHSDIPSDVNAALERFDELRDWTDFSHAKPVFAQAQPADGGFGPPVPHPRQVFAVALNYRPHAAEAGFQPPDEPLIFTKFPSCITGPVADVVLPAGKPDWESEVVAVIGAGGARIPRATAWDAVAGLTVGQDLSERVTQMRGKPAQFSLGKSYPGFGPTGPVAVTADEFADRDDIGFECRLGDEVVQYGRTREMIF